ncbi:MAG: DUF3040 domain-containing protein [Actinobacteria bacterium]|nr:DUF3040 domain-containing protein [Actinomycetota bacterium]
MGLSEREQQLLYDMERRLYQSEADVMQAGSGQRRRLNLRSVVLGLLVGVVGIGVMIGGVAAQQLWLGLIGFALMLGGAVLAFTRREEDLGDFDESGQSASAHESFSERMERRGDQRMEGDR